MTPLILFQHYKVLPHHPPHNTHIFIPSLPVIFDHYAVCFHHGSYPNVYLLSVFFTGVRSSVRVGTKSVLWTMVLGAGHTVVGTLYICWMLGYFSLVSPKEFPEGFCLSGSLHIFAWSGPLWGPAACASPTTSLAILLPCLPTWLSYCQLHRCRTVIQLSLFPRTG